MKRLLRLPAMLATCLCLAITTAGCNNGALPPELGGPEPTTRPEVAAVLTHQTDYAPGRVILEGAVIGAALGCGIGLLLGGGAKDCAIGAGVGAVAGDYAGAAVAEGNKRQILAEDKEDQLYAELQAEGEGLRAYNEKMEIAIARLNTDLKSLRSQQRKKLITAEQYEAELASLKRDSAALTENSDDQLETVEVRNEELEEYELSPRTEKARDLNLALVFDSAEQASDFDSKMENI